MYAVMGMLKPIQRLVAAELSQVFIYESSNCESKCSSDHGQDKIMDNAREKAVKKIIRSKEK